MFKTGKLYQYTKAPDSTKIVEYILSPNDIIEFKIYSNDGFKLIDLTNISAGSGLSTPLQFLIESDGNAKLPVLGRRKLSGLTIREAELLLEESFSAFFVKPFVMLNVTNKKVIVFVGNSARILPLSGNNTTVLEAIALTGGIPENGIAAQVKLIRKNKLKNEVYLLNLSTINGVNSGNMVLQANDLIYIEPKIKVARTILAEITPVISLITSAFIIFSYSKLLTK